MTDITKDNINGKLANAEHYFEEYIICNDNDLPQEIIVDVSEREIILNNNNNSEQITESMFSFTLQMVVPFILCGFGSLAAGQLLDYCQKLEVFRKISELYILVPSLMGLKGNLEMTMASRLSTAVSTDR
jgi:cation transporter-like permease